MKDQREGLEGPREESTAEVGSDDAPSVPAERPGAGIGEGADVEAHTSGRIKYSPEAP